jgi:hypothetical protein
MQYSSVPEISREEYEQMIQSGNSELVASALLSIAYWDKDWQWVEQELLKFVNSPNQQVRYTSILGFGYTARVNSNLNTDLVEPLLRKVAADDPDAMIRGTAEDALEDIEMFIHRPHRATARLN